MIEKAALEADDKLYNYILKAVTENLSYAYLKTRLDIPCSKDTYYDRYRRFFGFLTSTAIDSRKLQLVLWETKY